MVPIAIIKPNTYVLLSFKFVRELSHLCACHKSECCYLLCGGTESELWTDMSFNWCLSCCGGRRWGGLPAWICHCSFWCHFLWPRGSTHLCRCVLHFRRLSAHLLLFQRPGRCCRGGRNKMNGCFFFSYDEAHISQVVQILLHFAGIRTFFLLNIAQTYCSNSAFYLYSSLFVKTQLTLKLLLIP